MQAFWRSAYRAACPDRSGCGVRYLLVIVAVALLSAAPAGAKIVLRDVLDGVGDFERFGFPTGVADGWSAWPRSPTIDTLFASPSDEAHSGLKCQRLDSSVVPAPGGASVYTIVGVGPDYVLQPGQEITATAWLRTSPDLANVGYNLALGLQRRNAATGQDYIDPVYIGPSTYELPLPLWTNFTASARIPEGCWRIWVRIVLWPQPWKGQSHGFVYTDSITIHNGGTYDDSAPCPRQLRIASFYTMENDLVSEARHCDWLALLSKWYILPALKRYNPRFVGVAAQNAYQTTRNDADPDTPVEWLPPGVCPGFNYVEKYHPEWFLTDSGGQRFTSEAPCGTFFSLDPGNEEFQERWATIMISNLRQLGADALFIDDTPDFCRFGRFGYGERNPVCVLDPQTGQTTPKYRNDVEWSNAMASFLAYVTRRIHEDLPGVPIFANIGGGADFDSWPWNYWRAFFDGVYCEAAFIAPSGDWPNTKPGTFAPYVYWRREVDNMSKIVQMGKTYICNCQPILGDTAQRRYCLASYLLGHNEGTYFGMRGLTWTDIIYHKDFELQIGQPLGPYQEAGGVFRRSFTGGMVAVNPFEQSKETILPGGYSDLDGNRVKGGKTVLPPHTGLILLGKPSSPTTKIARPTSEERISGRSYNIQGTAKDDTGRIKYVQVSFDGGRQWRTARGTSAWQYSWRLPADGRYLITARAVNSRSEADPVGDQIWAIVGNTRRTAALQPPSGRQTSW